MPVELGNKKVFTSEVLNHNSLGMCCQAVCSKPYSEFFSIRFNGMVLIVPVCKAHSILLEEKGWEVIEKEECSNEKT